MNQITIGPIEDQETGRPPRMGAAVGLVAVLTLAVMVAIGDAGVDDDAALRQDLSASTSTTRPNRIALPEPEPVETFVEYSMAELIRGPQLDWQKIALPDELTVVYEVGERDGLPAVIGSRSAPDRQGEIPGATLYRMTGDGAWAPPVEVFGDDRYLVAGEISPWGFTLTSSAVVGRLSFADTTAAVHASPDGETWTEAPLGDDESIVVVDSVASDELATWVFGHRLSGPHRAVVEALPADVRPLLDEPLVDLTYDGVTVQIAFLNALVLYQARGEELGLDLSGTGTASAFDHALWFSTDRSTFVEAPHALGPMVPVGSLGGSNSTGVYLPVLDRGGPTVAGTLDGRTWDVIPSGTATGHRVVLGLDGALIGQEGTAAPRLEVSDGAATTRVDFDLRDSGEWSGTPAVGGAGFAIPTGRHPVLRPTISRWTVERDGVTITTYGDWALVVEDDAGRVESFSLLGDPPNVEFDPAGRALSLLGDDGTPMARLTLADLTEALAHPAYTPLVAAGSVLYTPDGSTWSWTPLIGITGAPGLASAVAVGEEEVYVIAGAAAIGPHGIVSIGPRLFVGTPQA